MRPLHQGAPGWGCLCVSIFSFIVQPGKSRKVGCIIPSPLVTLASYSSEGKRQFLIPFIHPGHTYAKKKKKIHCLSEIQVEISVGTLGEKYNLSAKVPSLKIE